MEGTCPTAMYRWRQMSWSKQILVVIFKEQMKEVLFVLRNLDLLRGSHLLLHRIPKSRKIAAFGQKTHKKSTCSSTLLWKTVKRQLPKEG